MAAAHGYFMVSGKPQVLLVHVDAGTQAVGGAMVQDGIKDVVASGDFTRFVAEVGCDTPEKALPWGACWQPCAAPPHPTPLPPSLTRFGAL